MGGGASATSGAKATAATTKPKPKKKDQTQQPPATPPADNGYSAVGQQALATNGADAYSGSTG